MLVSQSGITTQGKSLRSVTTSDDGEALWIVGGNGVVGRYDVITGQMTDYSNPQGYTTTFDAVEASGNSGDETVLLADTSGNMVRGVSDKCGIQWRADGQPTGGNAVSDINFHTTGEGHIVDSTGSVYESTDDGKNWSQIGVSNFSNTLYSIDSSASSDILAAGSSGSVVNYDGSSWTTETAGSNALYSIDRDGGTTYASGTSGTLYERTSDGWSSISTGTGTTLHSVGVGGPSSYPDSVVGGSGTILERGQYTATNDTFELKNSSSQPVQYEATVDGLAQKGGNADSNDSVVDNSDGTVTISGEVAADSSDGFNFSGDLSDVKLPASARESVDVLVNGREVSLGRVSAAEWTPISNKPTTKTLHSVSATSDGLFATGGGGKIVQRDDSGNWNLVVKNGPGSNGNTLYSSESTYSGEALWVGGSSGAFGRYDVPGAQIQDYSAPQNMTGTWSGIAVRGYAGTEEIYLGNDSGKVLFGEYKGGNISWQGPVTPGDGSAIRSINFHPRYPREVFMCDSNGKVFRELDQGNWQEIGIQNPGSTLYDINVTKDLDLLVSGGSGRIFRLSDGAWTAQKLGGNARYATDSRDDRRMVVGASGQIYEMTDRGWKETFDYQSTALKDIIVLGDEDLPAVAVGGSGTVLEKSYVPL